MKNGVKSDRSFSKISIFISTDLSTDPTVVSTSIWRWTGLSKFMAVVKLIKNLSKGYFKCSHFAQHKKTLIAAFIEILIDCIRI